MSFNVSFFIIAVFPIKLYKIVKYCSYHPFSHHTAYLNSESKIPDLGSSMGERSVRPQPLHQKMGQGKCIKSCSVSQGPSMLCEFINIKLVLLGEV